MYFSRIAMAVALLASIAPIRVAFAQYELEVAFPNLTFERPVDLQHAGDGTDRLFVVEQHEGRIRVFPNDPATTSAGVFLDLDGINTESEEGLLGLAFHPDYENNGYFYIYYSAPGPRRSILARYSVDPANPNQADPSSELVLMSIEQPYENHNGGGLVFGPDDGYLYIGLGDGGLGGDPEDNGEDPKTLLGSILRIDVDNPVPGGLTYSIPADNPFAGNEDGYREEIYAYGFRNPWRYSIDPVSGELWVGDVGQDAREEIDLVEKGGNYGWDIMEGTLCYEPETGCATEGLLPPVWEYSHDFGVSVIGGFVYRGSRAPDLIGKYIYADYGSRKVWALTHNGIDATVNEEIAAVANTNPMSFGVSENQELFLVTFGGKIFQFAETQPTAIEDAENLLTRRATLGAAYPNPMRSETTVPYTIQEPAHLALIVYDVLGRRVRALVDERKEPGEHRIRWTGNDDAGNRLPNGAYFLNLYLDGHYVGSSGLILSR